MSAETPRSTEGREGGVLPRLFLIQGGDGEDEVAPDQADDDATVAAEVAAALAQATDEAVSSAPLTLPLALSVCMERHAVGATGLIDAMQALRTALLAVSGLDPRCEPVPLVAGDARAAALGLAEYLRGLLGRAARASAVAPDAVASAAAAKLA